MSIPNSSPPRSGGCAATSRPSKRSSPSRGKAARPTPQSAKRSRATWAGAASPTRSTRNRGNGRTRRPGCASCSPTGSTRRRAPPRSRRSTPRRSRAPHMGGHPGHGAFGRQGAGAVMRHGRVLRRHAGGACGLPPRRRGARRPDRAHRPRPPSVRGDHPRRLRARRPRRRIVRRRGGKRALRQLPGRRSPPSGRGAARARLVLREGARLGEAGRHRGFRHVQRHARQEESRRPQKDRRARRARGSGPPAQHGLLAACRSHGGRGHPPEARARRGLRARMGAHRARRGGHRRELLLRIPPRHVLGELAATTNAYGGRTPNAGRSPAPTWKKRCAKPSAR